jgi:diguanylate cyclase (GGDEF)-like protein
VGDLVLRRTGELLINATRGDDIACRMGGEEFALILPGTDGDQAMVVAETLRHAIENSKGSTVGPVTISVGVASPSDGSIGDASALFRAADAALYQAKAGGRNRVVRYVNPDVAPASAAAPEAIEG